MSVAAALLIFLGVIVLVVVISLLIPVPDPDAHPFETDPWETEGERPGRHRDPRDQDEGPTRRLVEGPLRWPWG